MGIISYEISGKIKRERESTVGHLVTISRKLKVKFTASIFMKF